MRKKPVETVSKKDMYDTLSVLNDGIGVEYEFIRSALDNKDTMSDEEIADLTNRKEYALGIGETLRLAATYYASNGSIKGEQVGDLLISALELMRLILGHHRAVSTRDDEEGITSPQQHRFMGNLDGIAVSVALLLSEDASACLLHYLTDIATASSVSKEYMRPSFEPLVLVSRKKMLDLSRLDSTLSYGFSNSENPTKLARTLINATKEKTLKEHEAVDIISDFLSNEVADRFSSFLKQN